jgi:hypothetical protein
VPWIARRESAVHDQVVRIGALGASWSLRLRAALSGLGENLANREIGAPRQRTDGGEERSFAAHAEPFGGTERGRNSVGMFRSG